MLVPVVPVLNASAKTLGKDGLMNIFAGIPAGKEGEMNVKAIANGGVLVKPYLVQKIINEDGSESITQPKQIKRVISASH